jgi:hypothetical protein
MSKQIRGSGIRETNTGGRVMIGRRGAREWRCGRDREAVRGGIDEGVGMMGSEVKDEEGGSISCKSISRACIWDDQHPR